MRRQLRNDIQDGDEAKSSDSKEVLEIIVN